MKQRNWTNVIREILSRSGRERRREDRHDLVNGVAADPGLNSKPAAGDERPHERGNVRAAGAERCATENWEGDSITRAGMRVQDHRDHYDQLPRKMVKDRLRPIHSAAISDEGACKSDAGRHRNPKRGETADSPFPTIARTGARSAL